MPTYTFYDESSEMEFEQFFSIMERHGVKKINALNNKFDHNFHQAVFEVETKDKEDGVVVQEIQTGYTMYDRLLRPTMVSVSKKPKEGQKNS